MTNRTLEVATVSDEASFVAVMTLAFSTDSAARWTWPDPEQYLRHFPDLVKALGGKALSHGVRAMSTATRARQCGCRQGSILTKTS